MEDDAINPFTDEPLVDIAPQGHRDCEMVELGDVPLSRLAKRDVADKEKKGEDTQIDTHGRASYAVSRCFGKRCACYAASWIVLALVTGCVFTVVFLPWYMVEVQPHMSLEQRMRSATCTIHDRVTVGTMPSSGNTVLLFLPGLTVTFVLNNDGQPLVVHATATPHVERSDGWMSASVMDDYYLKYPVGAAAVCYYDPQDPTGRVAMANGIDGWGRQLAASISCGLVAMAGAIAMYCTIMCPVLWCSLLKRPRRS